MQISIDNNQVMVYIYKVSDEQLSNRTPLLRYSSTL